MENDAVWLLNVGCYLTGWRLRLGRVMIVSFSMPVGRRIQS